MVCVGGVRVFGLEVKNRKIPDVWVHFIFLFIPWLFLFNLVWLVEKLVLDWLDLSYPGGIYNRKKAQVKKIQTHMQYIPFFFFWFRIHT